MEGISTTVYKGLRGYWRRRGYERLNGSAVVGRRMNRVQLGTTRRRRFWRIKIKPKLKVLRMPSPKKFFIWLRDAYVNMMMSFANSRVVNTGYGGAIAGDGISGFGRGPLKEYDEKVIVKIYNSIVMAQQSQLVPRDAARIGSQSRIVCRS
ncbi:hypothetical protein ACOSP7_000487 [Xanthoceras sorbifolium]|uniref:Uncharacterized protein n=1 Tax=Xanthoceras sorbifolium TaxID=99658 RepID=A0ABQ8IPH5_9ROSI|nr:hypothetical protein JRO89_XS01G0364100 [Xanthoceras sorbifolium]